MNFDCDGTFLDSIRLPANRSFAMVLCVGNDSDEALLGFQPFGLSYLPSTSVMQLLPAQHQMISHLHVVLGQASETGIALRLAAKYAWTHTHTQRLKRLKRCHRREKTSGIHGNKW